MSNDNNKPHVLVKKILIKGEIKALTGLHIGGTNNSMSIGGMDNAVVRNPITKEPYIPGSSLKGKTRALLDLAMGNIMQKRMGKVQYISGDNPKHEIVKLYGNSSGTDTQRPSKVIFRDGKLLNADKLVQTDFLFTEAKTEVVIDRITSAAMPRQIERVPAGAIFELNIVVNVFEEDNESQLLRTLFKGLQLLQDDYLGGSGSRGSGQVDIAILEVIEKDENFYFGDEEARVWKQDKLDNEIHSDLLPQLG